MYQPILKHPPPSTPIERIFEKVVHRKMNAAEREAFHLNAVGERHIGISGSRSAIAKKAAAKLVI
jgi:hypothetical protein